MLLKPVSVNIKLVPRAVGKSQFTRIKPTIPGALKPTLSMYCAFAAIGIHGQLIYIDPTRRLVVAINSAWPVATAPERSAARMRLLKMIAEAADAEEVVRSRAK